MKKPDLLSLLTLIVLSFPVLFFLGGCGKEVTGVQAPLSIPGSFSATGIEPLPDKWWIVFQDEKLNGLIERSIAGNLSLQTAWDRLEQVRAVAGKSGAELFPEVNAAANLTHSATKHSGSATQTAATYMLGLGASYEIDLWGRARSTSQAARLDLLATGEDLQAASITLSAEVATAWYRLVEQQRQIELLQTQTATNEKYLDLVTYQFGTGQVPVTDVLQQRQILEASRADMINAETAGQLLVHQLAILSGSDPKSFQPLVPNTMTSPPPLPDTGLPAELLQRRPDIRRSYFRVQAADQRLSAAIADRFPKISLSANAETTGGNSNDLFNNWLATLAGNMIAPLFDGGRRQFEVARTENAAKEALHNYGQTILIAFKEVEDSLFAESQQRKMLDNIEKQLELSSLSTEQIKDRYIHGSMDFLRFLTALISHQELERSRIRAQRELIEHRINLCRALAGGWQLERRPPAAQLSPQLK
ncbi:MAG: TolC family protein [Pseudomonadota bacterium]